jgi:cell division protein FtsB
VSNTLEDESAGRDAILEAAFKQLNLSYIPW